MGRVRSKLIKRTAEKLTQTEKFAGSFEKNKKLLGKTMPSKRIRNMVAGYITQLIKRNDAKQK